MISACKSSCFKFFYFYPLNPLHLLDPWIKCVSYVFKYAYNSCTIEYNISSNNNHNVILSSFSRPEKETLERPSDCAQNQARVSEWGRHGSTLSPTLAGVWPYLQSEHRLYLWDCCRIRKDVSYKQIVGAQWLPTITITEPHELSGYQLLLLLSLVAHGQKEGKLPDNARNKHYLVLGILGFSWSCVVS